MKVRKTYTEFFITVSGLTVMVKGSGLRPVIEAIKLHTCDFIQESDPDDSEVSEDAGEPYIVSIIVEVMRGATPVAEQVKETR